MVCFPEVARNFPVLKNVHTDYCAVGTGEISMGVKVPEAQNRTLTSV
jgi:hypothetical protein